MSFDRDNQTPDAFVAAGQLCEHISQATVDELLREPIGRCWIYRCIGSPTLGRPSQYSH